MSTWWVESKRGRGLGVGEFGADATEYGWDDLTYYALDISCSLWAFLLYNAYLCLYSCLKYTCALLLLLRFVPSSRAQHLLDAVRTNHAWRLQPPQYSLLITGTAASLELCAAARTCSLHWPPLSC